MGVAQVNGCDLYYEECGTGEPLLMMHGGLGLDLTTLRPFHDPLGDRARLVYYGAWLALGELRMPIDILTGAPDVRVTELSRSGHFPFVEESAAYLRGFRQALGRQ